MSINHKTIRPISSSTMEGQPFCPTFAEIWIQGNRKKLEIAVMTNTGLTFGKTMSYKKKLKFQEIEDLVKNESVQLYHEIKTNGEHTMTVFNGHLIWVLDAMATTSIGDLVDEQRRQIIQEYLHNARGNCTTTWTPYLEHKAIMKIRNLDWYNDYGELWIKETPRQINVSVVTDSGHVWAYDFDLNTADNGVVELYETTMEEIRNCIREQSLGLRELSWEGVRIEMFYKENDYYSDTSDDDSNCMPDEENTQSVWAFPLAFENNKFAQTHINLIAQEYFDSRVNLVFK